MPKSLRRRGLLGSASLAVLVIGYVGAAQAQTTITVGDPTAIDPFEVSIPGNPDENILNDAATTGAGAGTTNILSFQTIQGIATGTATTGDSDVSIVSTPGDNSAFDEADNDIFSQIRGNNVASSIGTSHSTDGAVILNAQETVPEAGGGTALAATSGSNAVTVLLEGNGQDVTGSVTGNSISARASFNTAFGTIETSVPTTLVAGGGLYDATYSGGVGAVLPSRIDQDANYNVASVQANSGFGNGQADPADSTALVESAEISLTREYDAVGTVSVTGSYDVVGNASTATTLGNAADNSIFLLTGEASLFDGTAFASSTQMSLQSTTPTDEPAISASNIDSSITAAFANIDDGLGGTSLAVGDGMTAAVDDNSVGSTASINSSRNELGFDSALDLDGGADLAFVSIGYAASSVLNSSDVLADFATVNVQSAFPGLAPNGAVFQQALATTEGAAIGLFIEDADADSTLSVGGNAVSSTASGNVGTNVIRNGGGDLGDDSSVIGGTFASVNQQMLWRPDIAASTTDSDIAALVGTLVDGGGAFGGLAGSTLGVDGNSITATANGSVATGVIALSGLSLQVDRPEGAGGGVIADREGPSFFNLGPLAQFVEMATAGGATIANLQWNAQAGGDPANLSALVGGNEVFAAVNFDTGSGDVAAESVEGSTVSVDGNRLAASTTVNGFAGNASLAADTSGEVDVSIGSSQTVGFFGLIDAGATASGNNVGALVGVGTATGNLVTTADDNSVLGLVNGNEAELSIDATAGTELFGHGIILDGALGPASNAFTIPAANDDEETLNTSFWAAAAFLIANDQAVNFVDLTALVGSNTIGATLLNDDGNGTIDLANSTVSASGNDVVGQVLGNSASNRIALDAGTSLFADVPDDDLEPGAIAGIFNSQSAAVVNAVDITLSVLVANNTIGADLLDGTTTGALTDVTASTDSNLVQGLAFVNVASNAIAAEANTITPTSIDGVELSVALADPTDSDETMFVNDAGFYVVNRQRNEALDAEGLTEPGASVNVEVLNNIVGLTVNGGTDGASSSAFSTVGNGILATAAANVANSSIATLADSSGGAASGILSRQGNSGSVFASNQDSTVELTLNGDVDAAHSDVTLDLNQNVIGSSATGSSASNAVSATAGTTLTGTNGDGLDGVFVGAGPLAGTYLASIDSSTGTADGNAASVADGNLAILNTQRNYGAGDGNSVIASNTTEAFVALTIGNLDVDSDNVTVTLDGNQIRSQAVANAGTNAVNVTSGTGGPATGTILNNQGAADTDVSSFVLNAGITADVEGSFSNGTIGVTGNTIVASADLNNATNLITASAAVGGSLGSSTIANYQSSAGSSVSTSVTGASISTASGDVVSGALVGGSTVTASGNQIGTSGTINNSVNRIASPGQGFTRTSSF